MNKKKLNKLISRNNRITKQKILKKIKMEIRMILIVKMRKGYNIIKIHNKDNTKLRVIKILTKEIIRPIILCKINIRLIKLLTISLS